MDANERQYFSSHIHLLNEAFAFIRGLIGFFYVVQ